jgi:4-amino-4-deoxychorismate lyase
MIRFRADSPAVAHGMGLFETMLVVRGKVVQPAEHFTRLLASARALHFPEPGVQEFRDAVAQAIGEVESLDEAMVRCLYVADAKRWRIVATSAPVPATTLQRRKGARVITLSRTLTRALPQHKMTSYAPSMIGLQMAIAAGAHEGLFVDASGCALEGTNTNVFAIDGTQLVTAPTSAAILPGIVRAWVLEHAPSHGFQVIERAPTIDELHRGAFLTSSLTMLAPIVKIDGLACRAPGAAFTALRRAYRAVTRSKR